MRRGRLETAVAEPGSLLRWRGATYRTLQKVEEFKPGHYRVESFKFDGAPAEVFGGRKAGGGAHEWRLEMPGGSSAIECSSMADALRLLDEA